MTRHVETAESPEEGGVSRLPPRPGLVLVFSAGRALSRVIPLVDGAVEIGRDAPLLAPIDDPLLSRRHARVTLAGRAFSVRDLSSRNGTSLDGARLVGEVRDAGASVLRTGATLFLLSTDVARFEVGVGVRDGVVMGPALEAAWDAIGRAARLGTTLHLRGESGSGKELAARAFHALGPGARGNFVPVNCAAIPEALAERLLFGARRGAFSGAAADADGYVQGAHGGTLFLDEIAELDLAVQAKLLRVLEAREVTPLGASLPVPVDMRVCTATHKDLRAEVAARRLREDLYFRIARPEVAIPPLRERLEEIPWIIGRAVALTAPGLPAHVSLVEACLLRRWPGNVRELVAEIGAATQQALAEGSPDVKERHLAPKAGRAFEGEPTPPVTMGGTPIPPAEAILAAGSPASAGGSPARLVAPDAAALEALMGTHRGSVKDVAAALGCSRRQVGRWLDEHGIERSRFRL